MSSRGTVKSEIGLDDGFAASGRAADAGSQCVRVRGGGVSASPERIAFPIQFTRNPGGERWHRPADQGNARLPKRMNRSDRLRGL